MDEYQVARLRRSAQEARDACGCKYCGGPVVEHARPSTCMAVAIYLGIALGSALGGVASASRTVRGKPDDGSAGW